MDTDELLTRFRSLSSRIQFLQEDLIAKEEQIEKNTVLEDDLEKARWLLTEAQKMTQDKFKKKVENLVTMAINSVYERRFEFELNFERKRDKMECQPLIYELIGDGEDGQVYREVYDDPENELGGGIVDVSSFALRIVLWTMEEPRSRPFFLFDEPGKNLGILISSFGEMVRALSHKMGIQVVIISHDDALIDIADRSYHVEHNGRESIVTLTKGD